MKVNPLRFAAQLALYVPLMALIGYFSSAPTFHPLGPDEALLRVSFSHAAERKEPCRERTAEELAKLPPNMRLAQECPRERAPVSLRVRLDDEVIVEATIPPSGFKKDGPATIYWRRAIRAGSHRIVAELNDRVAPGYAYKRESTVTLKPSDALVIDFNARQGGFVLRHPGAS